MTIKSKILNGLVRRFGNGKFRYTDIVKEALYVRGIIETRDEYNWRYHRGNYACALCAYQGKNYMFRATKKNPLKLVKEIDGYRVQNDSNL